MAHCERLPAAARRALTQISAHGRDFEALCLHVIRDEELARRVILRADEPADVRRMRRRSIGSIHERHVLAGQAAS